ARASPAWPNPRCWTAISRPAPKNRLLEHERRRLAGQLADRRGELVGPRQRLHVDRLAARCGPGAVPGELRAFLLAGGKTQHDVLAVAQAVDRGEDPVGTAGDQEFLLAGADV